MIGGGARMRLKPPDHALVPRCVRDLFAGEAGDRIFHKTGSKQQQGSTGLLTRGMIDRDMFYGHAMTLAMVPFINPDLY